MKWVKTTLPAFAPSLGVPSRSRAGGGASFALAACFAAVALFAAASPAQEKETDRGSSRGSDSRLSSGSSRSNSGSTLRGNDRDSRSSRGSSSSSRRGSGREPAGAAESAGIARQGVVPAGAAGRGVSSRAQSRAITGSAAASIASRAPSTNIVFDYKVPPGQVALYFDVLEKPGSTVGGAEGHRSGDLTLVEGARGAVALRCHNPQGLPCDRIHLGLRYNPAAIRLTALDADPLKPFFRDQPVVRFDPEEGLLLIEAAFAQPVALGGSPLLKFEWKALSPAPFSQMEMVDFRPSGQDRPIASGLYSDRRNILGAKRVRDDGIVPMGYEVLIDPSKRVVSQAESLDQEIRLMRDPVLFGRGARGGVGLELVPESLGAEEGDEVEVRVAFLNPRQSDLDSVRLVIEFDPDILQVVDTDEENAIGVGVNIREGNRLLFPFDYFIENRADNRRGLIEYRMGMGGEAAFPARGTLATIRFKVVGRGLARIAFREQTEKRRGTAVSFLGKDVLGTDEDLADGLKNAELSIR